MLTSLLPGCASPEIHECASSGHASPEVPEHASLGCTSPLVPVCAPSPIQGHAVSMASKYVPPAVPIL